jgi:hypothetical protein
MPTADTIRKLRQASTTLTTTTAHDRYCNDSYRKQWDIPIHKFSVWISPEKYIFAKYPEKENLIVISPDHHPSRDSIVNRLQNVPELKTQTIQNLSYDEYKATIAKAKWTLTFGEGLDGYLIEPIFSGAIGFAVYNEEFFTTDFKELSTIYGSYEVLGNKIVNDIRFFDEESRYNVYQKKQFDICASHYSHEVYVKNIIAFYNKEYTFP